MLSPLPSKCLGPYRGKIVLIVSTSCLVHLFILHIRTIRIIYIILFYIYLYIIIFILYKNVVPTFYKQLSVYKILLYKIYSLSSIFKREKIKIYAVENLQPCNEYKLLLRQVDTIFSAHFQMAILFLHLISLKRQSRQICKFFSQIQQSRYESMRYTCKLNIFATHAQNWCA